MLRLWDPSSFSVFKETSWLSHFPWSTVLLPHPCASLQTLLLCYNMAYRPAPKCLTHSLVNTSVNKQSSQVSSQKGTPTSNRLCTEQEFTACSGRSCQSLYPLPARLKIEWFSYSLASQSTPCRLRCLYCIITKPRIFVTWQKMLQLLTCHSTHPWKFESKARVSFIYYF